jgi:membrane fusion protein, heavy metal efflux system
MFRHSASAVGALLLALMAAPGAAHEGHDHGAPPPPVNATAAPRLEATSDALELVAVARNGELTIFLDRFRTNEPVAGASIEVETPEGPATAIAEGDRYLLKAPWLGRPGRHDLIFTVSAGDLTDVLSGSLALPEPPPPVPPPVSAAAWLINPAVAAGLKNRIVQQDPVVVIAVSLGFVLGVLVTALVRGRRGVSAASGLVAVALVSLWATGAVAHEGHDHGAPPPTSGATASIAARDLAQRQPDGALFVPKPTQRILGVRTILAAPGLERRTVELPGRIVPDPNASGYVQASVSGRLTPPPGGFPRLGSRVKAGDVLAYATPPLQAIDASDLRQRQGELDQQIALVERRIARTESLVQTGAATRVQLDEARIELQGLKDRRVALDRVRREPEPLVAPVSGVIAAANAVPGQITDPARPIFHIVDPNVLWIEALTFDARAGTRSATARDADGRAFKLSYQGLGLADRNQAIPIHFRIEGSTEGLRLGQLVTVLAESENSAEGLVLPRASVLRGANGQSLVYVHTAAERFEPREVRVEPLDGERVLVLAGLLPNQRVVTAGAELLDQIR